MAVSVGREMMFAAANATFEFGQWHHIATTYVCSNPSQAAAGVVSVYVDGKLSSSNGPNSDGSTDQNTLNEVAQIGAWVCNYDPSFNNVCNAMIGSADEIRVSKTNRSADWIQAEYQNQSNPGGFIAVGPAIAAR